MLAWCWTFAPLKVRMPAGEEEGMAHNPEVPIPVAVRRILAAVSAFFALVTGIGLIALWPHGDVERDVLKVVGAIRPTFDGTVRSVEVVPCRGTVAAQHIECKAVRVEILGGPDRGKLTRLDFPVASPSPDLGPGDKIVLVRQQNAAPGFEYGYYDRQRKATLFWLALLFAVAVVLLGRLRGLAALAGLVASLVLLLQFVLPAILLGKSPALVATFGSAAIAYLALYMAHGFRPMTSVALLGTIGALILTVLLATLFTSLAHFSGFTSEESFLLNIGAGQIDLSGLILGGVIIGALGALDDMTVTQASAVWELRAASPGSTMAGLFRSGLRIGRDHVASTVNTLFLAYAGASLPLLLLFTLTQQGWIDVANGEAVATELVRTLVGSIGLVTAVPITTWLAAWACSPSHFDGGSGRHTDHPEPPATRS
jgi:uncharacterized membrane protein